MDVPPKHEGTQGTKNQASEKASGPLGFKPKTENRGLEATGRDRTSVSLQSQAHLQLPGATQRSVQPPTASAIKENTKPQGYVFTSSK